MTKFYKVLIALTLPLLLWGCNSGGSGQGTPPTLRPGRCASEDMVLVRIESDSYQYPAGTPLCIHIDEIDAYFSRSSRPAGEQIIYD